MVLTQALFEKYRDIFYQKVTQSPNIIQLKVIDVTTSGDSLKDFIGSSNRAETVYNLPVLYHYDVSESSRELTGIDKNVGGVIYLSPLQLIPIFGTFRPDYRKLKVTLSGNDYLVDSPDYREAIYDSCVAVVYTLKKDIRG